MEMFSTTHSMLCVHLHVHVSVWCLRKACCKRGAYSTTGSHCGEQLLDQYSPPETPCKVFTTNGVQRAAQTTQCTSLDNYVAAVCMSRALPVGPQLVPRVLTINKPRLFIFHISVNH